MKNYTENQKYFNDRFKKELEDFFYISRDITQKGDKSVRDTISAFLSGVGASVVVSRAADAVGTSGPISGICGLAAGGIAATYFYMSADESSVMHTAKSAVLFLSKPSDSKTCDSEFFDKISFRLVSEFRFSIEMLMKGDTGLNLLIKALVNRMITVITTAPHSKLTQLKTYSDKIIFITENIFNSPADKFEKDTKLTVSTDKVDLGWNLEELLFHSPILACSKNNGSCYSFYTYLHTGKKSKQIMPGKIDAEASYKYPPRIFDSEKKGELTANYRKEDKYTPLSFVSKLDTFEIIDDALVHREGISYIELFHHLRQAKTQNRTVKALFEAIECYNKVVNDLIKYVQNSDKNTSINYFLFIEIEMLRNIHRNVLMPLTESYEKEIENNEQYSKLFNQFKNDYDDLTKLGENIMKSKEPTGKTTDPKKSTDRQRDKMSLFIKTGSNGDYTTRSIKEVASLSVEGLLKDKNGKDKNGFVRFLVRIVYGLSFIGWVPENLVNGQSRLRHCIRINGQKSVATTGSGSTQSGSQTVPSESQTIKDLDAKVDELQKQLDAAEKDIRDLEKDICDLMEANDELTSENTKLVKANDELKSQNTKLVNQNSTLRERIATRQKERQKESKSMGGETESNRALIHRPLSSNVHVLLPSPSASNTSNSQNEALHGVSAPLDKK